MYLFLRILCGILPSESVSNLKFGQFKISAIKYRTIKVFKWLFYFNQRWGSGFGKITRIRASVPRRKRDFSNSMNEYFRYFQKPCYEQKWPIIFHTCATCSELPSDMHTSRGVDPVLTKKKPDPGHFTSNDEWFLKFFWMNILDDFNILLWL